jgi:hypothetical protein
VNAVQLLGDSTSHQSLLPIPARVFPAPRAVWLGNQWVSSAMPGAPRNHDLLYWAVIEFDDTVSPPAIKQFKVRCRSVAQCLRASIRVQPCAHNRTAIASLAPLHSLVLPFCRAHALALQWQDTVTLSLGRSAVATSAK